MKAREVFRSYRPLYFYLPSFATFDTVEAMMRVIILPHVQLNFPPSFGDRQLD